MRCKSQKNRLEYHSSSCEGWIKLIVQTSKCVVVPLVLSYCTSLHGVGVDDNPNFCRTRFQNGPDTILFEVDQDTSSNSMLPFEQVLESLLHPRPYASSPISTSRPRRCPCTMLAPSYSSSKLYRRGATVLGTATQWRPKGSWPNDHTLQRLGNCNFYGFQVLGIENNPVDCNN